MLKVMEYEPEQKFHHARSEPSGVREEMLDLGAQFKDAALAERIKPVIQSVLDCQKNCSINPEIPILKIRAAFYDMARGKEITDDEATSLVARMMKNAGEKYDSQKAVVDNLKTGNYSDLGL